MSSPGLELRGFVAPEKRDRHLEDSEPVPFFGASKLWASLLLGSDEDFD